jgi:hypothetical protein
MTELHKQYGGQLFNDRLGRLPLPIRDDVRAAVMTAAAKRNEVQKYLAGKFEPQLRPAPAAPLTLATPAAAVRNEPVAPAPPVKVLHLPLGELASLDVSWV